MLQLVTFQTCGGARTAVREQEGKQILVPSSDIVSLQVKVYVGAGRARSHQGLV